MPKFKVGQILYSINYDDKGKFETDEWHVRTIRAGRITAIRKDSGTWIKLSKKNFDWGWATSISRWDRHTWREGNACPVSLNKADAWKEVRKMIESYEDDGPEKEKMLRTCDSQITRQKKVKK